MSISMECFESHGHFATYDAYRPQAGHIPIFQVMCHFCGFEAAGRGGASGCLPEVQRRQLGENSPAWQHSFQRQASGCLIEHSAEDACDILGRGWRREPPIADPDSLIVRHHAVAAAHQCGILCNPVNLPIPE